MDPKKLFEEMQKAVHDFHELHAKSLAEIAKYGTTFSTTTEQLTRVNDRIDLLETRLNRPGLPGPEGKAQGNPIENKAYGFYLRKGMDGIGPEERKALSTSSDTEGGIFLPQNRRDQVLERLHEFSPVRALATVESISLGNMLEIAGEGEGNFDSGWVAERAARPETTTGDFRLERIPTHEMYAKPKATQRMLDDTAFNVEGYVTRKVGQRFGVNEGLAFISGDGTGKPEGLLHPTSVKSVNSGEAANITGDGMIDLLYAVPEFYAANGTWLLRRASLGSVRKLKDGQGNYLWAPGLTPGAPATILGMPYREAIDMPAIAANAFPVIFGDIRTAYLIVDRAEMTLLRDPYSSKPFVEFYMTRAVGGQVVLPEAIRKLKIAV